MIILLNAVMNIFIINSSGKVPGAVGFSIFFALLRARLKDEGLGR